MKSHETVTITLFDRIFEIKCPSEKLDELQSAANFLDLSLRKYGELERKATIDSVFMITALNLSNEIILLKEEHQRLLGSLNQRMNDLQNKITTLLAE